MQSHVSKIVSHSPRYPKHVPQIKVFDPENIDPFLPAAEASRSRCDAFLPFCVFDAFFEMEAEGTYPSSRLKIEGLVKSSTGPSTSTLPP